MKFGWFTKNYKTKYTRGVVESDSPIQIWLVLSCRLNWIALESFSLQCLPYLYFAIQKHPNVFDFRKKNFRLPEDWEISKPFARLQKYHVDWNILLIYIKQILKEKQSSLIIINHYNIRHWMNNWVNC